MARHPEQIPARRRAARASIVAAVAVAMSAGLVLAGCTGTSEPKPSGPSGGASATPSGSASATAPEPTPTAAPTLVPEGTAADNLPLFTAVTAGVWGSAEQASGRAYIDALIAAGFDRAAMQVTPDLSTVGNPAESIQFAVRWGEECLVGQVGPATGDPVTVIVPVLAEGTCLVGETRPIDW